MKTEEKKRTSEEIAAEIDHFRSRIDATLEQIEHRLTPATVIKEGITSLSHSGRYVLSITALARKYPIPSAALGVCLAVFLMARRRFAASKVHEEAASTAPLFRSIDAARGALRNTKETISGATTSGLEGAKEIINHARRGISHVSGSAQSLARERPLGMWAATIAICAAVALSIPYVRRNH